MIPDTTVISVITETTVLEKSPECKGMGINPPLRQECDLELPLRNNTLGSKKPGRCRPGFLKIVHEPIGLVQSKLSAQGGKVFRQCIDCSSQHCAIVIGQLVIKLITFSSLVLGQGLVDRIEIT